MILASPVARVVQFPDNLYRGIPLNTRAINAGLVLLALMVVPTVHAERIKSDVPACIDEAAWDALGNAAAQNDLDGMQQLHRDRQCTWLQSGDQVTVVDLGFETTVVRFQGVQLWTQTHAIDLN